MAEEGWLVSWIGAGVAESGVVSAAFRLPRGPTVISVSIWLPISSVLSTCYCLEEPRVA